ncbi:energy transducer TonB [Ekhidna sp. To15]|uniref:energy transducer TonB n=1 Tax=Ekhidna sp. To15 TaxID=3395267 RepID=UPI003F528BAB
MKKHLLVLTLALFVFGAQANNGNGKGEAEGPKPTNYKEVISQIEYPKVCQEKGIEGKVIVTLKVDETGKVINHEFGSYPCTDLRDAVKDAIKDLKFVPAKDANGNAIVGKIAVPVNFKLTI